MRLNRFYTISLLQIGIVILIAMLMVWAWYMGKVSWTRDYNKVKKACLPHGVKLVENKPFSEAPMQLLFICDQGD